MPSIKKEYKNNKENDLVYRSHSIEKSIEQDSDTYIDNKSYENIPDIKLNQSEIVYNNE